MDWIKLYSRRHVVTRLLGRGEHLRQRRIRRHRGVGIRNRDRQGQLRHQEIALPVEKVASTDNRTFEILNEWGIDLVAAPKQLVPFTVPEYKDD